MPKVSIIMPVFNCEAHVETAVRSVAEQKERDIELIVVNDGSTDRTMEILQKLASADSHMLVHSQANSGKPAIARNIGLSHSTGEYIAFLDADDLYHPDKIRRQLSVFQEFPNIDIVFHDFRRFRSVTNETESSLSRLNFVTRAADYLTDVGNNTYICADDFYNFISIQINPFHTSTVMLRRKSFASRPIRFREDFLVGEDSDLWFRLAKGAHLAFIDETLSYYRQHAGSVISDAEQFFLGLISMHTKNFNRGIDVFSKPEIQMYKHKIAANYLALGRSYFRKMKKQDARAAYRQSLSLKWQGRTLLALLKTFAPNWLVEKYRTRSS